MQPELDRGYVQRVRVARLGTREVALLDVRMHGETVHLVCAAGIGVGAVDDQRWLLLRDVLRAGASPGSRTNALWRARLEGASLARVGLRAIGLEREGRAYRAESGRGDAVGIAEGSLPDADIVSRTTLEERGAVIAKELTGTSGTGRHDALRRALGKAIGRVARRVAAVEGDLARIGDADAVAARAQLFVAAAAGAARGAERLEAIDWTTGQAKRIELPIDPSRGAREQIDGLFKRARRLKDGARVARTRLAEARTALATLQSVMADFSGPEAVLADLEVRSRAAAPRDFKLNTPEQAAVSPFRPAAPRPPYRLFLGGSGAKILVGRGANHNDSLTHRIARPHDLWLHAKDFPGAHVIVPLDKGASCPPDVLAEAAHLAAHFSDAREERLVDVQYTPRRYLRKPRGSPPGFVIVEREKVIVLRKNDEVLRRLLASEPA